MKVGILRKHDGKIRFSTVMPTQRYLNRQSRTIYDYYTHKGATVCVVRDRSLGQSSTDMDGWWTPCHVIKNPMAIAFFVALYKLRGRYD